MLLIHGIIAILFGIRMWFQPGISLTILVLLFGIFALLDGLLGVWMAFRSGRNHEPWGAFLLAGLTGIAMGILTFIAPGVTTLVLLFYIAAWAIATGVLEVAAAIHIRKEIKGEWRLILAGIISVAFGFLPMAMPVAGALAMLWLIGTYAFFLACSCLFWCST